MDHTTFTGVSEDEVASGNTGLYEFNSDAGHHIYLHDTDLVGVSYSPGPTPRLTTTFRYDRDWTPESLQKTPVIVIAFDGVRIIEWAEDQDSRDALDADATASSAAGQMSLFDWDGKTGFHLMAFAFSLTFSAEQASVAVRAQK